MEPSRRPLIEIEHVFVTYPGTERHILNDFNLTLYEGEHAVIRGGNGAGKSTLLRLLRGEQWPDQIDHRRAGRVLWHGPEGADPSPLTGRKVTSLVSAMQQERVMTTHRLETLPSWIGRQIVLENGKAVDGPMLETAVEPEKEPAPVASAPELKGIRGCSARIAIKDASVFIDRVPVLYDINWTINPGENWAVLGGNGAGKSTLLRLLAGDEIVAYGGEIVRELPRQGGVVDRLEVLRKGVRLVSDRQQATYTYDITGEELVFSGIDNSVGVYREPSEKELAQVTDILASLHLEFLAKRTIRSCSTGEFRRLLLARALAGEPDLLLLDEPFSGLDAPSRNEFFALLNQLARQGVQMILVTHHKADIFPAITHMLQLENGRISAIWEQG